jgi:hypothetical protein
MKFALTLPALSVPVPTLEQSSNLECVRFRFQSFRLRVIKTEKKNIFDIGIITHQNVQWHLIEIHSHGNLRRIVAEIWDFLEQLAELFTSNIIDLGIQIENMVNLVACSIYHLSNPSKFPKTKKIRIHLYLDKKQQLSLSKKGKKIILLHDKNGDIDYLSLYRKIIAPILT